ncbi:LuxR family transcriptional regulator [Streptomyces sp. NPDC001795]|uniref:LuxR family transcriptional regulator n=1 Tax=unclassified Streptomyces TaxID=2593676 RepID=UPI003325054F
MEISGEPGIGKTALLGALASRAEAMGVRVGRAHALHGSKIPYQLFVDVLQSCSAVLSSADEDGPEVPAIPRTPSDDCGFAAEAQTRLKRWAADRGGVLLLDNVHLCDEQSTALVARLVSTPLPGPFVLALAHRPRQTRPALLEALAYGVQTGAVTRVEPTPLKVSAVAAVLDGWRGEGGAEEETAENEPGHLPWSVPRKAVNFHVYAEQLHAASGGNPRIMRILAASRWDPDGRPLLSAGPDRDGLLREAASLTAEVRALAEDAAVVAGGAAVLGGSFVPEDVATVCDFDVDRTLSALGELVRSDLIRPPAWGGQYAFRHPVLAEIVLEGMPPALRLVAHRRALGLLTERQASVVARARQAEHLLGSGGEETFQTLVEGAAEVMAQMPAAAARWLRLVLDALPVGEGVDPARALLALDCCRALAGAGRLHEARSLAHEVLRHGPQLPGEVFVMASAVCGDIERLLGRYQEADAVVRAALDLLPRPLPHPLPAEAHELVMTHGKTGVLWGTYPRARDLVQEANRAAGETAYNLHVLAAFGDAQLGLLPEAAHKVTECARLVDGLPDATAAAMPDVFAMLGCAEMYLERFTDAYRHLGRGLETSSGGNRKPMVLYLLLGLSVLDQWTGRPADSRRRARDAELLARSLGVDEGVGLAMVMRAAALMWTRPRRDGTGLSALARKGLHRTSRGRGWWRNTAVGLHAQVQLFAGDAAGCIRTLLEEGGGEGVPRLQRPFHPSLLAILTHAALQCGDMPAARRWADAAEAAAEQLQLPLQTQHATRARAMLDAAEGRHDRAAELFDRAADSFRRGNMPMLQALTLVNGAPSIHVARSEEAALTWLETATEVSGDCGALRIREEAARVRAHILARRSSAGWPAGPYAPASLDVLTDREREIAQLAAVGKRSREIADQLFLSARTVDSHLSRIYRKLDISSRAALSRLVAQMPGEQG